MATIQEESESRFVASHNKLVGEEQVISMPTKQDTAERQFMAGGQLLLTLPELAVHLRVDRATVYRLLQRGDLPIPVLRLGRSSRVRVSDVERFLAEMAEAEHERRLVPRWRRDRQAV